MQLKSAMRNYITTAGFLLTTTAQQLLSKQQQYGTSVYHLKWRYFLSQSCGKYMTIPLLPSKPLSIYISKTKTKINLRTNNLKNYVYMQTYWCVCALTQWINNKPPLWIAVLIRVSVTDKYNNKVVQGYQKINGWFNLFECLLQIKLFIRSKRIKITIGLIKSFKGFLCEKHQYTQIITS